MRGLASIGYAALLSGAALAQSSDVTPKFGTVDVHASAPNTIPRMRSRFSRGRYELGNATVVDLIRTAWDVDADNVLGGPGWLGTDRFDVIATAPPGSSPENLRAMLRALLADRFQLAVHTDTRKHPAFAITLAKKLQLKAPANSEETGCQLQPRPNPPIRRGPPRAAGVRLPHYDYGGVCESATQSAGRIRLSAQLSRRGSDRTERRLGFQHPVVDARSWSSRSSRRQ